ncbi:MAG: hypothetical protein M1818_006468 [Claussenomyces sp. TS43310]|nr:MAG: hypothetical protein M1818_006468 [Claussenomyces sp. TS43310]
MSIFGYIGEVASFGMNLFALPPLFLLLAAGLTPVTSTPPVAVHNSVISASSLSKSLTFYVDGLGLNIISNYTFAGDLKTLFGTDSSVLPGYFLGDASSVNNGTDGVLYLVEFADVRRNPTIYSSPPETGFFLTSFWLGNELNSTLARLERLGLGGKPHVATFKVGSGPLATYATVRDPDGARVLLTSRPYINSLGKQRA